LWIWLKTQVAAQTLRSRDRAKSKNHPSFKMREIAAVGTICL